MNAEEGNSEPAKPKNGVVLNWPTILMILLTGGGNLLLTGNGNVKVQANGQEVDRAVRQIRDLHESLDGFEKRQKDTLEGIKTILDNQTQMLGNQKEILEALHKKTP